MSDTAKGILCWVCKTCGQIVIDTDETAYRHLIDEHDSSGTMIEIRLNPPGVLFQISSTGRALRLGECEGWALTPEILDPQLLMEMLGRLYVLREFEAAGLLPAGSYA